MKGFFWFWLIVTQVFAKDQKVCQFVKSTHIIRRFDTTLRVSTHLIIIISFIFAPEKRISPEPSSLLMTKNEPYINIGMNITEFFYEEPILAIILTLGYGVMVGVFIYLLVRMYKK